MKKTSKILVLLLSVALAITALVIAVSADTTRAVAETGGATYATLEAALDAATSEEGDGYVKLIADTTISQTYSVSKSVTLDLSGFTLNTVLDGFNVSGATVFTVKGAGAINCSSWFVTVQSGEGVPVVDVIGTDVGIKVQAVGGQFISAASGEITVKNYIGDGFGEGDDSTDDDDWTEIQ
jgi:pectin methylesterase-like acyl-CoA thioesterase